MQFCKLGGVEFQFYADRCFHFEFPSALEGQKCYIHTIHIRQVAGIEFGYEYLHVGFYQTVEARFPCL